ncbi:ATP-binding protein [Streptomyces sp. NPDC002784]
MTTQSTAQGRSDQRALVATDARSSRTKARPALDVSIQRHPDSNSVGLSPADSIWPQRLRRIVRAGLKYWGRPELAEEAELLLTELATNALRHGQGPQIGVRICLRSNHLKIEVNDGSPARPEVRQAAFDDETGRGLFLVASIADTWGVSDDGTTTWCTLPLTKGPEDMQPAALTAPVVREIPLDLPADPSAAGLARIKARSLLTLAAWPGNQHHAIDVLHALVDNAVQHALAPGKPDQSLSACLSLTEAHELLVDVTDPLPRFPDFDQAVTGDCGRGLWEIARQGVELSWFLIGSGFDAKTVRAVLRPGLVEL